MDTFTEEDIKLAEEAERYHELIASGCTHLPDGTTLVTGEFDSALYLERLMKTVKKLRTSKDEVSNLVEVRAGRRVAPLTRLGNELALACKLYRECFYVGQGSEEKPRYSVHKFHPYLVVALQAIAEAETAVNDAVAFNQQEDFH